MTTKKILIVDDNDHQHELMRVYSMRIPDIQVLHANTIEEGIEQAKTNNPDVIFLDNRLHPYDDFRQTVPKLSEAGFSGKIVIISSEVNEPYFSQVTNFNVAKVIDKAHVSLSNFPDIVSELIL